MDLWSLERRLNGFSFREGIEGMTTYVRSCLVSDPRKS